MTLDEVAEHVQKGVNEATTLDRTRLCLIHNHLPRLADHDVIEFDQRSATIRYYGDERVETLADVALQKDESEYSD